MAFTALEADIFKKINEQYARLNINDDNHRPAAAPASTLPTTTTTAPAPAPDPPQDTMDVNPDPPRLLQYPPEIREMIYAYALSVAGKIAVKSRTCNPPALAQVNRQLRAEATATFYAVNTFHFSLIGSSIHHWIPFASPERLSWLALDLETSIMFFHTMTQYLLQPTRVLDEDEWLTFKESAAAGREALAGGTVIWGTRERIIESLAKNPRPYPFLTKVMLEKESKGREEAQAKRDKAEEEYQQMLFDAGIIV